VKKWKPGVIHINPSFNFKSFFRDGIFAWQAKQMGYSLLVFWHGWEKDFEATVSRRYLSFFNHTFGRADGFIVLASEFEDVLRDWGIVAPIFQLTTCVDDSLFRVTNMLEKWSTSQNISTFKVLFLARLARSKGVFETVQAIKILLDQGMPVQLTVAGDGELRMKIEEFARSLSLSPMLVKFTGDIRGQDKVMAFYQHHIYCFPTYYGEGLPTSVLEAMASGMPVITRPVGGLKDFFKDGEMGFFVDQNSPEEIAANLKRLILNPSHLAEIGRKNALFASNHFMASVVAEKLNNIYGEIIIEGKTIPVN